MTGQWQAHMWGGERRLTVKNATATQAAVNQGMPARGESSGRGYRGVMTAENGTRIFLVCFLLICQSLLIETVWATLPPPPRDSIVERVAGSSSVLLGEVVRAYSRKNGYELTEDPMPSQQVEVWLEIIVIRTLKTNEVPNPRIVQVMMPAKTLSDEVRSQYVGKRFLFFVTTQKFSLSIDGQNYRAMVRTIARGRQLMEPLPESDLSAVEAAVEAANRTQK